MHALSHHSSEQHASVLGRMQEALSLAPLIKSFSAEGRTANRLLGELKKNFGISLEESTVHSVAELATNSIPGIARVFVLALGACWVIQGHWTLGSLIAFQAYLGYVFGPAQSLASANLQLQNARTFLERVCAMLHVLPEENMGRGRLVERLAGEVEFRQVTFSYNGYEPVLKELSFHIRPGEHVAILGPSGAGKTTLLNLILRFYRPTAGEVYFDGQPASELEVSSLRRRIGYVSQNTLLLSATIRENLLYGNSNATEEQIIDAARVAEIHDFIARLPGGYDTLLGEKGINLSEGQKQRLSLARALVKDPDILILDEPAAALDSLAENSIFHSLPVHLRGKTMLIVTHRLSAIRGVERIILLNENRVVGSGTHASLLESCDLYRSLVACQHDPVGNTEPHSCRRDAEYAVAAGI
jgi:ABC-type bacteriocin/lantibiotic exporter with double-glycine peptidase domain